MAIQYQVAGPVLAYIGTGADNALEVLGYNEGSVQIQIEQFFEEVHSDDMGGTQIPGDLNFKGQRCRIRLELTRFDSAVADKVTPVVKAASAGVPANPGTLMIQDNKAFRLLLYPRAGSAWNFPRAILREPAQINKGTDRSVGVMVFEAYKSQQAGGILYNTSTTGMTTTTTTTEAA